MSYYNKGGRGGGGGYRGGGGGYHGGGGRGGGGGWRGGGRGGSFNSGGSRGGGGSKYPSSYHQSSSYDTRSRSSYSGGGEGRYNRDGREDSYQRYAQEETGGGGYSGGRSEYSSSRALSPEPPRKRQRPDSSPSYMNQRRSHERSFGSEYASSGRGFYDKGASSSGGGGGDGGGYMSESKPYTREVRERPEYSQGGGERRGGFRKPGYHQQHMGQRQGGGGFRGRSFGYNRGGGMRGGFRNQGGHSGAFLRRREFGVASGGIRKRIGLPMRGGPHRRNDNDYLRRLKLLRLRRMNAMRRRHREGSDDEEEEEDLDLDDLVKSEDGSGVELEDDDEPMVGSSDAEEVEEEEEGKGRDSEGEEEDEDVGKKEADEEKAGKEESDEKKAVAKETKKKTPVKKVVKKKIEKSTSDKDDSKTSEGEKEGEEGRGGGKEEEEGGGEGGGGGDESGDEEEEGEKAPPLSDFIGTSSVKLRCPQCHFSSQSFKEYSKHLEGDKHQEAMQDLFAKLRKTLSGMRMEQRNKQKILDEECKAKNMRLKTFFCPVCKLNYRTLKSHHQASSAHRKMSEFLLPYCKICKTWFKSAWQYESHLCDLPHIKRKIRLEKLSKRPSSDRQQDDSLLAEKEESDMLDTSSFMVLDAVGSGDESDGDKSGGGEEREKEEAGGGEADEKATPEKDGDKKKIKKKPEIKLGVEHCKLVKVYYCELCKLYLPRTEDTERALTVHCRSRTHLQRYVRLNKSKASDADLRRKAVRLHKERQLKLRAKITKKEVKEENKEEEEGDEETREGSNSPPKKSTRNSSAKRGGGGGEKSVEKEKGEETGGGGSTTKEEEEKTWSEVDKDLSELLEGGDDGEEETEEVRGEERYDRFKKSDKSTKGSAAEADVNGDRPLSGGE